MNYLLKSVLMIPQILLLILFVTLVPTQKVLANSNIEKFEIENSPIYEGSESNLIIKFRGPVLGFGSEDVRSDGFTFSDMQYDNATKSYIIKAKANQGFVGFTNVILLSSSYVNEVDYSLGEGYSKKFEIIKNIPADTTIGIPIIEEVTVRKGDFYSLNELGEDGKVTVKFTLPIETELGDTLYINDISYKINQGILDEGIELQFLPESTIVSYTSDIAGNTSLSSILELPKVDSIPPSITLNGDREVSLKVGEEYTELGATCEDTDTTCEIIMRGTVDTTAPGEYTIEYEAKDENGNISETIMRFVTVVAKIGTSTKGGTTFRPEMHNASDGHKINDSSDQIEIEEDISEFLDDTLGSDEVEYESDIQEDTEDTQEDISESSDDTLGEEDSKIETEKVEDDLKKDIMKRMNKYDSCIIIYKINNPEDILTQFRDLKHSKYAPSILHLEYAEVIDGRTPGYFNNDDSVTRAEFLKMVLRAHCQDYRNSDTSKLKFTDLDKETWMAKVAAKSLEIGIIDEDNTEFRANDSITRLEATKILINISFHTFDDGLVSKYINISRDSWVYKYVSQAEQIGLYRADNKNKTFKGGETISRDMMSYYLEKIINLYDPTKPLIITSDY